VEWPDVWFGILGTLEVRQGGELIPVRAPRHRALLAVLLCKPNQVLGVDEVAEAVWDGKPPGAAVTTLRSYVMRLRRALGRAGERIETFPPGYRLNLDTDTELDSTLFHALWGKGHAAARAGDWSQVSSCLSSCLALWRGTPLQDVPSDVLRLDTLPGLLELHVQATELRLEAQLKHGRPAEAIPGLRDLIIEHPLRERPHALLMTALAACDRRSEALQVFRDLRGVLDTELGVEPGQELQDVHREILMAGDRPAAPRPAGRLTAGGPTAGSGASLPTPWMLPADISDFTGREPQVSRLLGDLSRSAPTVVVSSIAGMGGIGKTTFAIHVAHRVRPRYPDGQLFANLQGTAQVPAEPGAVLGKFLRQLGVDPALLPVDTDERSALYRSLLADRRVLILLDDARDAAQLAPLIPGTAGCAVLVTMRNRAVGLAGAIQLDLDALSRADSYAFLSSIAGASRVAAEPDAVSEVLTACADLPLAIRLVGARLVSRPSWRIRDLADRLQVAYGMLDELSFGDQGVRASFEVSYAGLSLRESAPASATRAFCLLGLWTGRDISLSAAASLLGLERREAQHALEYLVDMCLVQSAQPGRYSMHDLIRAFAAERAERELQEPERRAAIGRLITWYTLTANAADTLLVPPRPRAAVERVAGVAPPAPLRSRADAIEWGESEHANLVSASHLGQAGSPRQLAWQLPTALWGFFMLQRHLRSLLFTQEIALSSAVEAGDETAEATVRNNLAIALIEAGSYLDAIEHLNASLSIRISHGDQAGMASTLNNLGAASMEAGLPDAAIEYLLRSLSYREATGAVRQQADVHANLGNIYLRLGRFSEAITECEAAEKLVECEANVSETLAQTLAIASQAHHQAGDLESALSRAEQVTAIRREMCDQHGLVESLQRLGEIHRDSGSADDARKAWLDAIDILHMLEDSDARRVDTLIAALARLEPPG
jgi:DNA-binding SARP family transcriptional activator/tetratricopeptide (TPR) repeat protein